MKSPSPPVSLLAALLCAALAASGCAATAGRVSTAAALDRVLAAPHREPANSARDVYRHPKQTLLFFGLRPQMHVVEILPAGGWYTEVLAPLLREHGRYYAAQAAPRPDNADDARRAEAYRAKLARHSQVYDKVEITVFDPGHSRMAPPASVDMVLTFRNLHNWMDDGNAAAALADMYAVLKPAGVLGVVDHRADPAAPPDPKASSGYVNQEYAIRLIEAAGFKLVATSEINANPLDTRDHPSGVWTLPPVLALGDQDREKYRAIGESDRFTLKFIKPAR